MRYYDGELSPAEAEQVERLLARDEIARARLAETERLGDAIRHWAELRANAQGDLTEAVMARIDAENAPRPRRAGASLRVLPVVASALALAAAIAIFVSKRSSPDERGLVPGVARPAPSLQAGSDASVREVAVGSRVAPVAAPAVSIETVDFGDGHGSIFVVSSERGDTPVVWLSDDPAISPQRTHPL